MTAESMRRAVPGALLFLAAALGSGCGETAAAADAGAGKNDGGTGGDAGAGGGSYSYESTLVPILAADDSEPIASPHRVIVLDGLTGEPVKPAIETMSEAVTGKLQITVPYGLLPSFHIVGNGTEADDTYDSIVASVPHETGETLLRVSQNGTATLAGSTANVSFKGDRAALAGAVYWSVGGRRMGAIGCATLFLDDADTSADEKTDQRYSGPSGLPTTIDRQAQTDRSGRLYFGNMTKGEHTIRVSLDEGKTFIGEGEFVITRVRQDALGPSKYILYQIGIDIEADENPTPADCPM